VRMREGELTQPGSGAELAGATVPVQMRQGASPVSLHAQGRAQSRCRCGRGEPSPGADPFVGDPTWEAMSSLDMSISQHFSVGPSTGQAAKEALESRSTDVARVSPVAVQMWKERKGRAPSLRAGPIPVQMWDLSPARRDAATGSTQYRVAAGHSCPQCCEKRPRLQPMSITVCTGAPDAFRPSANAWITVPAGIPHVDGSHSARSARAHVPASAIQA
jgi:hypothetical protein